MTPPRTGMRVSPSEPASRTFAWWLFATGVALSMLLSANALLNLGIPYDAPYGPVVAKIHPGSYVLVLAWFVALASHGNPIGVVLRQWRDQPLLATYLGGMVTIFAWVIYRHGSSGAAYIVQTLWMPAIAAFTMLLLGPVRQRQTLWLVMGLLACNAALALVEFATKSRLETPAPAQYGLDYFRASAFLGHPLLNSNVTIALLPAVLLLPLKTPARIALALLLVASVLSFGSRTALIGGVVVYGACLLAYLLHGVAHGRYSYLQVTGGSVGLMLGLSAMAGVVLATGLGERIFQNLVWDNSASVRTKVWSAFDYLHGADWWLGLPPAGIDRIALAMGLDPRFEAIENFWIYTYLQFGAIGYVPFIVGIGCLTVWMLKVSPVPMRVAVLLFYLVASTANALSSKSPALTLLAVTALASAAALPRAAGTSRRRTPVLQSMRGLQAAAR